MVVETLLEAVVEETLRFLGIILLIFGGGYVVGGAAFLWAGLQGGLESIARAVSAFMVAFLLWGAFWLWVLV
jgi:hypothetical protein